MINALAALILFAVAGASSAAPSRAAPDFQVKTAEALVVVATTAPGESYATPEECKAKDVICMRFPLWFLATPIAAVYGPNPAGTVQVTTYTHYGQPKPNDEKSPSLMLLLKNSGEYFMPTYASERLWKRTNGQYYLLVDSPYPIHWLPCSASDLLEPVTASDFSEEAGLPADDFSVKEHREWFNIRKKSAFPRYGIRVSRIAELLRRTKPKAANFACHTKDES